MNQYNETVMKIVKETGMPPQVAQQIATVLPKALQTQGIDIKKLPPQMMLDMIKQIYPKIQQQKSGNPAQMNALAQAANANNK